MQLAGPGVFGPPRDPSAARAVLRRAIELGVDHIDTSQYYGPGVVNDLIRQALYPYPENLKLVTKVGARRDETGRVLPAQRPDELRDGVEANLRSLRVERLDLVNLRLVEARHDTAIPLEEQLSALEDMRQEGKLDLIGLSNVDQAKVQLALEFVDVAGIQNGYSIDRQDDELVDFAQVAALDQPPALQQLARADVAAQLVQARELLGAEHDRMSRPSVITRTCAWGLVQEAGDQVGPDPRHVAKRDDYLVGAAKRRRAAAQRRRLAGVPLLADDDLGAPEVNLCADLVGAAAEHDDDPIKRGDGALGGDGVLEQRAAVEFGEQLRVNAEAGAGTGGKHEPGGHGPRHWRIVPHKQPIRWLLPA
jgi:hypothetical protein